MFRLLKACVIFALMLFLYTLTGVASFSYGRCDSQFNGKGVCVQLADCQFIVDVISGELNAQIEETLRKSQCGYDNTFTENMHRIVVCCPEKYLNKTHNPTRTEAKANNVLPRVGECGTVISEFIYGGNETRIMDYPWMALIRYKSEANELNFLCGGSLISTRYVLTAAHCINRDNQADVGTLHSVRFGEWDLRTNPDCEIDVRGVKSCAPAFIEVGIEQAISHPKYISTSNDRFYDIALLRLVRNIIFTDFIRPICLPAAQKGCNGIAQSSTMEVAGWGATNKPTAISSPVKLAISVKIWESDKCYNVYKSWNRYINSMYHLCAGGVSGIDACRGDSGGPLMLPELLDNRIVYFVVGIISFGPQPCGLNGWPGVYACVANYLDWIESEIKP